MLLETTSGLELTISQSLPITRRLATISLPVPFRRKRPSGTLVGTLTAKDPNAGDTHTFALISSSSCANTGADNSNFSITGNALNTSVSFDYETKSSYTACIQVTDNNGLSYTAEQTITILDIVEATLANTVSTLPDTGFPMGQLTQLPSQPADKTYASYSDIWLEIPKLTVSTSIVGVPLSNDGWDVAWLGKDAGWLNGTSFPTWTGNSVITGMFGIPITSREYSIT